MLHKRANTSAGACARTSASLLERAQCSSNILPGDVIYVNALFICYLIALCFPINTPRSLLSMLKSHLYSSLYCLVYYPH